MSSRSDTVVPMVPGVRRLLVADFHQDWQDFWPDAEAVFREVVDPKSGPDRDQLREEVQFLASVLVTEEAVTTFLQDIESGLVPQSHLGLSSRDWLRWLLRRLEAEPAGDSSEDAASSG